jgi:hypothetical protein
MFVNRQVTQTERWSLALVPGVEHPTSGIVGSGGLASVSFLEVVIDEPTLLGGAAICLALTVVGTVIDLRSTAAYRRGLLRGNGLDSDRRVDRGGSLDVGADPRRQVAEMPPTSSS